jgi:hypothetical protein
MKVKTLLCLQPNEQQADCVVLYDDVGNPIFAAAHVGESILCASVGDKDFATVLQVIGLPAPAVIELAPQ